MEKNNILKIILIILIIVLLKCCLQKKEGFSEQEGKHLDIKHGVETIKDEEYYDKGLKSVKIPNSVTSIDDDAFDWHTIKQDNKDNLTKIHIINKRLERIIEKIEGRI